MRSTLVASGAAPARRAGFADSSYPSTAPASISGGATHISRLALPWPMPKAAPAPSARRTSSPRESRSRPVRPGERHHRRHREPEPGESPRPRCPRSSCSPRATRCSRGTLRAPRSGCPRRRPPAPRRRPGPSAGRARPGARRRPGRCCRRSWSSPPRAAVLERLGARARTSPGEAVRMRVVKASRWASHGRFGERPPVRAGPATRAAGTLSRPPPGLTSLGHQNGCPTCPLQPASEPGSDGRSPGGKGKRSTVAFPAPPARAARSRAPRRRDGRSRGRWLRAGALHGRGHPGPPAAPDEAARSGARGRPREAQARPGGGSCGPGRWPGDDLLPM
jgi:hypothetical protein